MTKEIDIHTSWDQDDWNELTDLVDEFKDSRKHSKKYYSKMAFRLALEYLQDKKKDREMKANEFREIEKEINKILEDEDSS